MDYKTQLGGLQEVDAVYDRLVIVLIDALRADMVLGSASMRGNEDSDKHQMKEELNVYMPFTSGLVTSGRALGYVAHASVPTVTMPRLKALVTGKAPAFIDILKNFNSAALVEDTNVVSLLVASGKRIVFYGDDTWLKLFPKTFKRSDGTSGFYTRDTVEVDYNVTRHLREELDPTMQNGKSRDWDVLVLHYLGLDHVGHLRGPRSTLMQEKLQEMDHLVQLVVGSVREQDQRRMKNDNSARPSLIVLCSDHGMSEVGNHGGATVDESSALLMFMRGDGEPMHSNTDRPYRHKRNQVDLVPTLSSLFGLPIPFYSTGLLLDDVIRASSSSAARHGSYYLRALYLNFQQLYALTRVKFHPSTLASFDQQFEVPLSKMHKSLQSNEEDVKIGHETETAVLQACEMLQAKVAQSDGSEYNVIVTISGVIVLVFSGVAAVAALSARLNEGRLQGQSRGKPSSIGCCRLVMVGVLLVVTRMLRARNQVINFWRLNGLQVDINIPGNEFARDESVSIWSTAPVLPSSILPLNVCVAFVCGVVLRKAAQHTKRALRKRAFLEFSVGACSGLLFVAGMMACVNVKELLNETMVEEPGFQAWTWWIPLDADASACVVYASVVLITVLAGLADQALRLSLTEMIVWLLVSLLQRNNNYPTLCLLCLQMELVTKLLEHEQNSGIQHSGVVVAGLALWLSQAAFFALGNSHLVTTIDISQSYHGLSSYSQSLVGALTFVSVFSGQLVCFVNLFHWCNIIASTETSTKLSIQNSPCSTNTRWTVCLVILTYQTLRFAVYTVVVFLMRFHLFIWSVFAPKMLYEFAHVATSLVLVIMLASTIKQQGGDGLLST
ncbi:unnamed protein product [Peronospora destructor]|uniref:GPI ethanolamine phosphate transferase 2 C-terminal domain-containing protein n=1 Tax=Peronospora destructor TaxID=86335 RepID=A0AAV0VBR4_9STRA|nr:unnamed protein product [Peronospora destructor]